MGIADRPAGASAPAPGRKLLDRVRDATRVLHYGNRTEDAHVNWCRCFILFHGKRHPDQMAEPEVEAFLSHLAAEGEVAASTKQAGTVAS